MNGYGATFIVMHDTPAACFKSIRSQDAGSVIVRSSAPQLAFVKLRRGWDLRAISDR
jgi:hypothetical protein